MFKKHLHLSKVKYGVGSPKFIWAPCVQLYSLAETPPPPPPPPIWANIQGAIGQPRYTTSLCGPLAPMDVGTSKYTL